MWQLSGTLPKIMSKTRSLVRCACDTMHLQADVLLSITCAWASWWCMSRSREAMSYAGWPPSSLKAAMSYAADPFLAERLLAWATAGGCGVLCVVLALSAAEGTWAVLRRA